MSEILKFTADLINGLSLLKAGDDTSVGTEYLVAGGNVLSTIRIYSIPKKNGNTVRKLDQFGVTVLTRAGYDLGDLKVVVPAPNVPYREDDNVAIGDIATIKENLDNIVKNGKTVVLVSNNMPMLQNIMSLLVQFLGMDLSFESYLNNPDGCVTPVWDNKMEKENVLVSEAYYRSMDASVNLPNKPGEKIEPHGESEMMMAAMMVTYSMLKSYDESTEQFTKIYEARCKAFAAQVNLDGSSYNKAKNIVLDKDLKRLNEALARFPKFKVAVCRVYTTFSSPVHLHVSQILKMTQMTRFGLVDEFLKSPDKCRGHLDHSIITETSIFLGLKAKLEAKYGGSWPYFKIFEPSDTTTAITQFPNLAKMALYYQIHRKANTSLKQMKGYDKKNEDKKMIDLVNSVIPLEFLNTGGSSAEILRENADHIIYKMFNVDKILEAGLLNTIHEGK